MFKKIIIVIAIVIISGISAVLTERYLFPYLSATRLFSKYKFLGKSVENTTVINKTEQIYLKEETNLAKVTNETASVVVNILSLGENEKNFKNGTGTIVTSDGIIMTHKNAILFSEIRSKAEKKYAGKYWVLLSDGRELEGEIIYADLWSDLVFLKINAANLPVVSFANSDETRPGEKMVIIGNNLPEYQNRFKSGLVENFDHSFNISGQAISTPEKIEGVFMVDIKNEEIFPGSPAVDYSAKVFGITGSTFSNNKTQSFVIPAQKIKRVIDKVIRKDYLDSATLGIYYATLNKSFSKAHGLEREKGAYIFSPSGQEGLAILGQSPAQKAGLKIYDIILKVGEEEISRENNLSSVLYGKKKGDQIELTILRSGAQIKIPVQF